jgi:membrane protease YdiL (CAAX protease family)
MNEDRTDLPVARADLPVALPAAPLATPVGPHSAGGFDLLIGVAFVWGMDIVLGTMLGLFVIDGGADITTLDASAFPPMGVLVTSILSAGFACLVSWYFICRRYQKRFMEGFSPAKVSKATVLTCVGIGVLSAILAGLYLGNSDMGDSFMAELTSTDEGFLVVMIIALVVPPFEEIYYRGFLFPIIRKYVGGVWAIVIVSLWFGAAHVFQLSGDWWAIPIILCMGVVWTTMRHVTGSLVPSIVTHWIYNLCLVLSDLVMEW